MGNTIAKARARKASHARKAGGAAGKATSGVVDFYLQGMADAFAGQFHPPTFSAARIIEAIPHGLSVNALNVLQTMLDQPIQRPSPKLGISSATFNGRIAQGWLERAQSNGLV